ncbi:hypothetical protein [Bacillus sp. FSL L8-0152]|uniref:hypothetical protein n=1 Tax=Bacillus sp. FSL L8-0152 TaxID=2921516 RepID=UPI0030F7D668
MNRSIITYEVEIPPMSTIKLEFFAEDMLLGYVYHGNSSEFIIAKEGTFIPQLYPVNIARMRYIILELESLKENKNSNR